MLLLTLVFTTSSAARNQTWKDSFTLLSDSYRKSPVKARTVSALGTTIFLEKGMYEESVTLLQKAIELDPRLEEAHYGLGLIYYKRALSASGYLIREKLLNASIEEYMRALAIRPGYGKALPALADAYAAGGKTKAAIDLYEKMRASAPNLAIVRYNLGIAYQSEGRHDEAIREFEAAAGLEPTSVDPLINLGVSHTESGRHKEAIAAFKRALVLEPRNADALYDMGITYERMGLWNEALNAYSMAVKARPGFTEAESAMRELLKEENKRP